MKDKRGDAPKAIDIAGFKANNGKKKIIFTIKFRSLRVHKMFQVFGSARPKGAKKYYGAGVSRSKSGKFKPFFIDSNKKLLKCRGIQYDRIRNTVVIRVPQRCFGKKAGAMRFGVASRWVRRHSTLSAQ